MYASPQSNASTAFFPFLFFSSSFSLFFLVQQRIGILTMGYCQNVLMFRFVLLPSLQQVNWESLKQVHLISDTPPNHTTVLKLPWNVHLHIVDPPYPLASFQQPHSFADMYETEEGYRVGDCDEFRFKGVGEYLLFSTPKSNDIKSQR